MDAGIEEFLLDLMVAIRVEPKSLFDSESYELMRLDNTVLSLLSEGVELLWYA
jgi:hypothetical protein